MDGLNRVLLVGSIDGEPKEKSFGPDRRMLRLRVHTSEEVADERGVLRRRLGWHWVVAWGAVAEAVGPLRQGTRVAVDGRLQHRKWEDDDGHQRTITEVQAHRVHVLGR